MSEQTKKYEIHGLAFCATEISLALAQLFQTTGCMITSYNMSRGLNIEVRMESATDAQVEINPVGQPDTKIFVRASKIGDIWKAHKGALRVAGLPNNTSCFDFICSWHKGGYSFSGRGTPDQELLVEIARIQMKKLAQTI